MLRPRQFLFAVIPLLTLLLEQSVVPFTNRVERVRAFTRAIEFNYLSWTFDAVGLKIAQGLLDTPRYLTASDQQALMNEYLDLIRQILQDEAHLQEIYANPNITDPDQASQLVRQQLQTLYQRRATLGPLAEGVLQTQLSAILQEQGLTLGDQPLPPVLYHSTPLPLSLVVSPRDVIRQDANISLQPDLSLDQQVALEETVDRALNVSSLVVPVGGVGTYPTMVMQTTDLNWLAEVVAHEWTHNYLSLRPLGMLYTRSPELRTINETVASIAGKTLGRMVIARFYPDRLPPPPASPAPANPSAPPPPPTFDFRAEMHQTRVTVDRLLAEGRIEEAEAYMEARRRVFWEHGYHIRKINQAYFAFYGAYADQPGGAAGEDPVGEAVRTLWDRSPSLADFLHRVAWITSFAQLQQMLKEDTP